MQLAQLLSDDTIARMKAITRKPKVVRIAPRKYVFRQEGEGRRIPGGMPPSGLQVSSLLCAIEHAHVFGVRGGVTKRISFKAPLPKK
jgi:hypothetical protein